MATIATYTIDGKKSGTVSVPKLLASAKPNHDLLQQVVTAMLSNLRHSTAHTKNRGDVSGGGRKPWRQKGTGRARAGSSRSPLWRGGGITFGPRNVRNYHKRLTGSMREVAFSQVLAEKIRQDEIIIVTKVDFDRPKTKLVEQWLSKLPVKEGQLLLIANDITPELKRAAKNLPYLTLRSVKSVNTLDLLRSDAVIIGKEAFESWASRYGN